MNSSVGLQQYYKIFSSFLDMTLLISRIQFFLDYGKLSINGNIYFSSIWFFENLILIKSSIKTMQFIRGMIVHNLNVLHNFRKSWRVSIYLETHFCQLLWLRLTTVIDKKLTKSHFTVSGQLSLMLLMKQWKVKL